VTTPVQRTRSVLQTRTFLSRLLSGEVWPELPREVQHEARRLFRHYPELWHVSRLHEGNPDDWGSVSAAEGQDP
jgi:hypothetical protein